jgi:hypothetical protein
LVNVTARKIRDLGGDRAATGAPGRAYTGYLVSYPAVGRGMVIFRDPNGHRMVTTPVRRVLGELGRDTLYVETENSVYRLTFRAEPASSPPPLGNRSAVKSG